MMGRNERPAQPIFLPPTEVAAQRSTDTLALDDPDIVQALTFIRAQACQSIQIADILKVVPLSRRSLERKFRDLLGHSPTAEIRRVKLAKARKLLAETDLSVEAIAAACGFGTYNYLTRVFTAEYGVSPRVFRSKLLGR
jgi:LacI family transcriptional regulator